LLGYSRKTSRRNKQSEIDAYTKIFLDGIREEPNLFGKGINKDEANPIKDRP